jgi:hypothetical protein
MFDTYSQVTIHNLLQLFNKKCNLDSKMYLTQKKALTTSHKIPPTINLSFKALTILLIIS